MGENESRLVLHVQIAAQLQGAMTLRAVHEDRDGKKIVADRQLAAGEDRPGRDAELVPAGFALEQRARLVGIAAAQPQRGQTGSPSVADQRISLKASRASSSDMRATFARERRAAEERRKCCDMSEVQRFPLTSLISVDSWRQHKMMTLTK